MFCPTGGLADAQRFGGSTPPPDFSEFAVFVVQGCAGMVGAGCTQSIRSTIEARLPPPPRVAPCIAPQIFVSIVRVEANGLGAVTLSTRGSAIPSSREWHIWAGSQVPMVEATGSGDRTD